MENGPCRASRDANGVPIGLVNLASWNEKANVLWVDQPATVGLSYNTNFTGAGGRSTEPEAEGLQSSHDQVANKMLAFLRRWEERFPGSHNGELFIYAESYGG